MRVTEYALCGPSRVLERRHGLAEIVERGAGVDERSCVCVDQQPAVQRLPPALLRDAGLAGRPPAPIGARAAPAPAPPIPVLGAIHRPKTQPRPFGAARTYAAAPGAFGAPGPPVAAPPPPQGGSFGGLFAGGNQAVPPKMPRGSATTAPPRDYGSGFSSTYSAFGGGGLGLFASAPGFITTTPRVVDDSSAPGAPGDTTRRSSP